MDSAMMKYVAKKIHLVAILLLVIGGLNWGYCGIYGKDFLSQTIGKLSPVVLKVVFVLVGLAALYVGFRRDTYLPFLGETVMPCSVLVEKTPDGASVSKTVVVNPGAKVLFWASEPNTEKMAELSDWRKAYLEYANAGVTTADAAGNATLRVRKPQPYKVPVHGRLESHIHYRVCGSDGFLGPVQTLFIGTISIEGFEESQEMEEEEKVETVEDSTASNNMIEEVEEGFEGYDKKKEEGSALDDAFSSPLA
jgi:uncharacterized membrane protein YuzA (DUF378 family)